MSDCSFTPTTPILVRPRAAADALSICERKLWSLTQSGVIPCIRVGRAVRYSMEALRQWAAAQQAAAEAAAKERGAAA